MANAAPVWRSEIMGWPEPAEGETDVTSGPARGRGRTEVRGRLQPASGRADVTGGPGSARRETGVMGGPGGDRCDGPPRR
jgi:hypothetical protein